MPTHSVLPQKITLLCSALILSLYDYACTSWYSALPKFYKNRLQTTQNKVARFLLNLGPRSHIGANELQNAGLLSVENRVKQLSLSITHKIYYNSCPPYLHQNFIRTASIHNHCTRDSHLNFYVPLSKGQIQNTFFVFLISCWNSLPTQIRSIGNTNRFKSRMKKYLFDQAVAIQM